MPPLCFKQSTNLKQAGNAESVETRCFFKVNDELVAPVMHEPFGSFYEMFTRCAIQVSRCLDNRVTVFGMYVDGDFSKRSNMAVEIT